MAACGAQLSYPPADSTTDRTDPLLCRSKVVFIEGKPETMQQQLSKLIDTSASILCCVANAGCTVLDCHLGFSMLENSLHSKCIVQCSEVQYQSLLLKADSCSIWTPAFPAPAPTFSM